QIPTLQQGARALEVEWHRSIFSDAKRANDFWFAGFDILLRDAEPVLLVERENDGDELFITDAGADLSVEQITSSLGQRRFVNFVDGIMERFDVEQTVLHMGGIIL